MSSFLSRINSKTGQVLNLNPDNPQPVSINNGLIVSGQTTFDSGLNVTQRIGTEGYIYNSLTSGVEDVTTDLRVVNKRIQPDRDGIIRKLNSFNPINCGNNNVNGIAWSSELKLFVIATTGTSPRISSDGISWTAPNTYASVTNPVICWSPELSLFIVGNGVSTNQPFRTNSTPASTSWVTRPTSVLSSSYSIYSIVWAPELALFVATTNASIILTSSDGLTWNENSVAFTASTFKHNLVWSSELGIFVLSAASSIYYSYNGINWALATGITTSHMVAWSPTIGHFVSTYIGNYHTSRDGINWTSRGSSISTYFLKWIDDLEMFIGQDSSVNTSYSYDGVNWNSLSTITTATDAVWSKELSSLILISATNPNVYLYGPILPSIGSSLLVNPSYFSINNTNGNLTVTNSSYLSTTSGSVGIGNSSPGYKLDVSGTGRFTDTFSLTKATGNSLVVSSIDSSNSSIVANSISTLGGIGITGNSFFSSTTDSSSITTGSVVFSGGLGIAKKLFVGTDSTLGTSTTGTLSLPNTTLSGTVLTVSNATDSTSSTTGSVTLAGGLGIAKKLFVGTDSTLGTSTTGTLSLPNTTLSGTVLTVSNATDSTSSTTGSVTLAGGLGIAKKLFVGTDTTLGTSATGTLSLPNTTLSGTVLSVSNTTDSSSSTTGSVTLAGGLGVAKKLFVGTDTTLGTSTTGTISLPNTTLSGTVLTVSNGTDSSSSTTGSVTLAGGLGVAKKLFVGTDTTLGTSTTGTISLPNTTLSGTVLTVSNGTDSSSSTTGSVTLAGGLGVAKKLFVGTDSTLGTSTTGTLSLPNTTLSGTVLSVLNATDSTSSTSGSVTLAGGLGVAKKLFVGTDTTLGTSTTGTLSLPNTTLSGTVLTVSNATDSTSSTTGSVTLAGGLGIAKKLFVAGITSITSTTVSTSTTTGALTVAGGLGIAGIIYSNGIDTTNNSGTGGWSYIGANLNGTEITGTRPGFGFGWNRTASQGENIMTYYTGGGTTPRFDLCSWDGTTRTVRMTIDSSGSATFNGTLHPANGISIMNSTDGGVGKGIYVWTRADTNWAIYMATAGALKSIAGGTTVASPGFSSHGIRFRVSNSATNGFIFENSSEQHLLSLRGSDASLYLSGIIQQTITGTGDTTSIGSFMPSLGTNNIVFISLGKSQTLNNCSNLIYNNATTPYLGLGFWGNDNILNVSSNGNVGIKISNPNGELHFPNTVVNRKILLFEIGNNDHQYYGFGINSNVLRYQVSATTTDHVFYSGVNSTTSNELARIKGDSSGIQTSGLIVTNNTTPSITVRTSGGGEGSIYFGNSAHGVSRIGNNNVVYTTSGSVILRIDGTDRLAQSSTTTTITGNLSVSGSLSKGSGTFDIKHPTLLEKRLVHSFIEGPRCDLIYRGTKKLVDGKVDINLDKECTNKIENSMTEGTFITLCVNPVKYLHNNSSFSRVIGSISGNILTITCEDPQSSDTIDWMVIAERKDTFIKEWNRTDGDGELITEYDSLN
jgi:hypothetical protein